MEASSSIGGAGEGARVSQESGAMPFASLRGLRVAFTGEMVAYPEVSRPAHRQSRDERAAMAAAMNADQVERQRLRLRAAEAGCVVEVRVTRETDLVVAGKCPGSKLLVAQGHGTPVVSPDTFRRLLEVSR